VSLLSKCNIRERLLPVHYVRRTSGANKQNLEYVIGTFCSSVKVKWCFLDIMMEGFTFSMSAF